MTVIGEAFVGIDAAKLRNAVARSRMLAARGRSGILAKLMPLRRA
jgi:hypothetical protein